MGRITETLNTDIQNSRRESTDGNEDCLYKAGTLPVPPAIELAENDTEYLIERMHPMVNDQFLEEVMKSMAEDVGAAVSDSTVPIECETMSRFVAILDFLKEYENDWAQKDGGEAYSYHLRSIISCKSAEKLKPYIVLLTDIVERDSVECCCGDLAAEEDIEEDSYYEMRSMQRNRTARVQSRSKQAKESCHCRISKIMVAEDLHRLTSSHRKLICFKLDELRKALVDADMKRELALKEMRYFYQIQRLCLDTLIAVAYVKPELKMTNSILPSRNLQLIADDTTRNAHSAYFFHFTRIMNAKSIGELNIYRSHIFQKLYSNTNDQWLMFKSKQTEEADCVPSTPPVCRISSFVKQLENCEKDSIDDALGHLWGIYAFSSYFQNYLIDSTLQKQAEGASIERHNPILSNSEPLMTSGASEQRIPARDSTCGMSTNYKTEVTATSDSDGVSFLNRMDKATLPAEMMEESGTNCDVCIPKEVSSFCYMASTPLTLCSEEKENATYASEFNEALNVRRDGNANPQMIAECLGDTKMVLSAGSTEVQGMKADILLPSLNGSMVDNSCNGITSANTRKRLVRRRNARSTVCNSVHALDARPAGAAATSEKTPTIDRMTLGGKHYSAVVSPEDKEACKASPRKKRAFRASDDESENVEQRSCLPSTSLTCDAAATKRLDSEKTAHEAVYTKRNALVPSISSGETQRSGGKTVEEPSSQDPAQLLPCTPQAHTPGVVYDKSGNKWTARWTSGNKQFKKTFAVSKYGYAEARKLAEKCRSVALRSDVLPSAEIKMLPTEAIAKNDNTSFQTKPESVTI